MTSEYVLLRRGAIVVARETWAGRIHNLIVTKENSATDWVIARLANNDSGVPEWFALELSHRTPTSMAMYNLLRDARAAGESVRLVVNRDNSVSPDWQRAIVVAVEAPKLAERQEFN
jgi:hypothetical protein